MNKLLHPIRLLLTVLMLLMSLSTLCAKEITDSVFSFRFISGRNMFYVPFDNNSEELARLFNCVDRYKEMIKRHEVTVRVNGYCNSTTNQFRNLAIAKIRSNRVKSELITRKGLTENCFLTRNHSGEGNFVTVSFTVPKDSVAKYESLPVADSNPPEGKPEKTPETQKGNATLTEIPENEESSKKLSEEIETPSYTKDEDAAVNIDAPGASEKTPRESRWALKTNLLYYAILMPNIEGEWMCADRWSVALEAQRAWYAKETPHKVYRIATVIPEARYWVIEHTRWHGMYVGLFVGGGLYDLCNGKKGHEGEGVMGGVSVGYMWPISKHFSLDAGIGAGYLRLRNKEYLPEDGHYLYQLTKNINYFGPLRLKLSLVWRI